MTHALRSLIALAGALCLGAASALRSEPYRWRAFSLERDDVTAIALPAKDAPPIVAVGGTGYLLRDPKPSGRIPMEKVTGVAVGAYAPGIVVAVGHAADGGNLRFSLDGGENWRPCPNPPALEGGSVVVSSDGRTWVWSGDRGVRRSGDYGFTWSTCEGIGLHARVVADRTSSRRFYALEEGHLYVTDDGAQNFEERLFDLPGGLSPDDRLKDIVPTPGRVGDLWLLTSHALYRALPGKSFMRVPGVADPVALAFGLAARDTTSPGPLHTTLFVAGTIEGGTGLFRSGDEGVRWTLLDGAPPISSIASLWGDPRRAGRVYVAILGGGLVQGTPIH